MTNSAAVSDSRALPGVADLPVAYADTRADALGHSLSTPQQPALARVDAMLAGWSVSVRLLGASHQILVSGPGLDEPLCETVACLTGTTSLPPTLSEGHYRFASRIDHLTDDELACAVDDLVDEVSVAHRRGLPALLGRFPGSPLAVTAVVVDSDDEALHWQTWHTYPQTGEAAVTTGSVTLPPEARR